MSSDTSISCGSGGGAVTFTRLRIMSVFVVLTVSIFGAAFPVLAYRSSVIRIPRSMLDFTKYFGSGVIIATGSIHLLGNASNELRSPCLGPAWHDYPYAMALAMIGAFSMFIAEVIAFRIGTARLKKLGISRVALASGQIAEPLAAQGSEESSLPVSTLVDGSEARPLENVYVEKTGVAAEASPTPDHLDGSEQGSPFSSESAMAQVIGVAILEFGIILHSVLIGLTLAVNQEFKVLFVVITFHQFTEGLGVGSRLACLNLPRKYRGVLMLATFLYGITTPLGIAVGLGIRTTYNPDSTRATLVSGVLDALSAGILMYTGYVELHAHEFVYNREMREASNRKLWYALTCMLAGCGIMASLAKWT